MAAAAEQVAEAKAQAEADTAHSTGDFSPCVYLVGLCVCVCVSFSHTHTDSSLSLIICIPPPFQSAELAQHTTHSQLAAAEASHKRAMEIAHNNWQQVCDTYEQRI